MSRPIAVLPLVRADDGLWEADIQPVHGGDDLVVRDDLDPARAVKASVRIAGVVSVLRVFVDDDQHAVAVYDEALPAP
jgi:hypothetical protein